MNILIVYCHPSKKSYTFQVLEQLKSSITAQHWTLEISDLYEMGFQSDMTEREYEREGFSRMEAGIPADVLAEHKKIEKADCIIFLYPVWWSDCPAKLKGWFDRVFCQGYAYGYNERISPMKTIPYGLVLCTAGHPVEFLRESGMVQSMQTILLEDRLGKRFEYKEMVILGGTLKLDQVRTQHQFQIEGLISKINNSRIQDG